MGHKRYISPVESFIDAYLKRLVNTNNIRHEKAYLDKASKMIDVVLTKPCCTDPDTEIEWSRKENFFIIQLRNLLNGIDLRKWRQSLTRAKASLDAAISNPCCVPPGPPPPEPCPTLTFTSDPLEVIVCTSGRDCGIGLGICGIDSDIFNGTSEPNLAQAIAESLQSHTTEGTFTYDNVARTVSYTGPICDTCDTPGFYIITPPSA